MTQELIERTVSDWVFSNPSRGARELRRLARLPHSTSLSREDVAEALIELAGRLEIAHNRAW